MKSELIDNSNERKFGAVLSYVQMGIGVLIGLVFTPIMIRLLGKSEYGLLGTIASTISLFSVLSLGFNSSYIRYFSRYRNSGDEESISRLNGLYMMIFSIIGCIAFICCLVLSFNLELVFKDGLSTGEYIIARKLMLINTIGTAIAFPLSVFTDIICANERFIFLKITGIIAKVINPVIAASLLFLGYKAIALTILGLILQIIVGGINFYYVVFVLKQRFDFGRPEFGILKDVMSFTLFIAISMIVDQINWNVDKILLGRYCGTFSVAVYSVSSTLQHDYFLFSSSISEVFSPKIHRIFNEKSSDVSCMRAELSNLFIAVGRMQFMVLAFIGSCLVLWGKEFIRFWAGKDYTNSYYVAMLLIIPVTIPYIQNTGIEIQRAMNKHKFRSICYAAMALVNIAMSIILCKMYAEVGAAIGTAVSMIVANGIIMNVYYHKECKLDIIAFWKNILKISVGLIAPVFYAVIVKNMFTFDTISKWLVGVMGYALIYAGSLWWFSMNSYEKMLVKSALRKVRKEQ
ncbi:MAG: oligosaccharide flippase family protein [Lachnospiraceae bacterium]|nr:oligosaccharide flippase family protein [Lachnospiraceae bacterium]